MARIRGSRRRGIGMMKGRVLSQRGSLSDVALLSICLCRGHGAMQLNGHLNLCDPMIWQRGQTFSESADASQYRSISNLVETPNVLGLNPQSVHNIQGNRRSE